MLALKFHNKLTLTVGLIATIVASLSLFAINEIIFAYTENQIKNELEIKHKQISELAKPEKSQELATYLRSNDLSLFIFDDLGESIARYGIYRDLDSDTLKSFSVIAKSYPDYQDLDILNFGKFDIYTDQNIQVASKNNVLPILRKSFFISVLILLPVVWLISILASKILGKIILSPLLRAKNISHELRTPLTRAISNLQVIIEDSPKTVQRSLKQTVNELLGLGLNVEGILSLSSDKPMDSDKKFVNFKKELEKIQIEVERNIKLNKKVPDNLIIPIHPSYLNIILRNLIDNAIKYNIQNGFINLKAQKTKDMWVFTISNSTKEKTKSKGYGLGTTIVKDICHKLDLNFEATKLPNSFTVTIRGNL